MSSPLLSEVSLWSGFGEAGRRAGLCLVQAPVKMARLDVQDKNSTRFMSAKNRRLVHVDIPDLISEVLYACPGET